MSYRIKQYAYAGTGAMLGAVIGYLIYEYYGCMNGCSITGSPVNSTLYFAFLGALTPNMFKSKKVVDHD